MMEEIVEQFVKLAPPGTLDRPEVKAVLEWRLKTHVTECPDCALEPFDLSCDWEPEPTQIIQNNLAAPDFDGAPNSMDYREHPMVGGSFRRKRKESRDDSEEH